MKAVIATSGIAWLLLAQTLPATEILDAANLTATGALSLAVAALWKQAKEQRADYKELVAELIKIAQLRSDGNDQP